MIITSKRETWLSDWYWKQLFPYNLDLFIMIEADFYFHYQISFFQKNKGIQMNSIIMMNQLIDWLIDWPSKYDMPSKKKPNLYWWIIIMDIYQSNQSVGYWQLIKYKNIFFARLIWSIDLIWIDWIQLWLSMNVTVNILVEKNKFNEYWCCCCCALLLYEW